MKTNILDLKIIIFLCIIIFAPEKIIGQEIPYSDKKYGGSEGGIVGKISDSHDVTPTGQFSYSIPIPVVAGTGGVKPALTISYNSSTKDGLLGYGFDLEGLSIISRTPKTLMTNSLVSYVNFSWTDDYMLDGVRLTELGIYSKGGYEYRTENDRFARIIAEGQKENPSSFNKGRPYL